MQHRTPQHARGIQQSNTITEAGVVPLPALYAVAVQIYYHWVVRRQQVSGTTAISWNLLRGFAEKLLASPQHAEDALFRYIYALSLAHLGLWVEANALFAQLRQPGV